MSRRDTQLLNKAKNHYMAICEREKREVSSNDREAYALKQVAESKVCSPQPTLPVTNYPNIQSLSNWANVSTAKCVTTFSTWA